VKLEPEARLSVKKKTLSNIEIRGVNDDIEPRCVNSNSAVSLMDSMGNNNKLKFRLWDFSQDFEPLVGFCHRTSGRLI
jgi:hypothetical protein